MAELPHGQKHVHFCSFPGCSKTFSRPNRLIIHTRSHTGEKPFKCDVDGCGKQYARSTHLCRHQENAHCDLQNPGDIICPVDGCGMKFTLSQNLTKHLKRRHEESSFKCEVPGCEKVFKKHQHLKAHEFDHTGINPFVCSYEGCGMRFRVPSKLHRHEKVHTGYSCHVAGCSAHFTKWTLLRKHTAVDHTTEHRCEECGKLFSQKQWLKQHMRIHSEVRDIFACPRENCGRSYLDQRNLLAHIRSYHDGQRFLCQHERCQRKFTSEQKLKEHQRQHDPSKPVPKKKPKKSRKKSLPARLCGVNVNTETMETDKIELPNVSLDVIKDFSVRSHQQMSATSTPVNSDGNTSFTSSDLMVTIVPKPSGSDISSSECCSDTNITLTENSELNDTLCHPEVKQSIRSDANGNMMTSAGDPGDKELNLNGDKISRIPAVNVAECSLGAEVTERSIC